RFASIWLDPRRGTSTLLLNALAAAIVHQDGQADRYLTDRTAGFDRYRRYVEVLDLDEVEAVTGVLSDKITACSQLLLDPNKKVVAIYNLDSRRDRSPNDLKA